MKLYTPQEFLPKAYDLAFDSIRTFIEISCDYQNIDGVSWYNLNKLNSQHLQDRELIEIDLSLLEEYTTFLTSQTKLKHLNFIPECKFILSIDNETLETHVRFL
jgi:hypothetical protein